MSQQVVGLLENILSTVYGQYSDKSASDKAYKAFVPILKETLESGVPFSDPRVQNAIEHLKSLPPYGARRLHFSKRYLKDKESVLSLPNNPSSLAYGYWW
ncbi:hypothetical protein VINI7043_10175 [Vibrio nigripulchritudo ATCC 27043]|uniref:hypothetical protein n=1 Tax=Vibrio nigripulchritudo TaxID=28173 RepID=UPI00021C1827|nr:hypothetical protein [Vibrio nigripulchritudo]EGU59961.1 hypothetical protein VINI7043_10175 [Vibrio nigripulchritudo ATCC 27043]